MIKSVSLLALIPLCGCALQGQLSSGATQLPQVLGEIEMLKTAVGVSPIAGCAALLQQTQGVMSSLQQGTPVIPSAPAPSTPPVPISPNPVPPVVVTPPAPTPT